MLRIAICDDELLFAKRLRRIIRQYLNNEQVVYQIDVYGSANDLLERRSDIIQYTAIFLDINMADINGIEAAKKIRALTDDVFIIFVTAYIQYSIEGYKINVFRYILKDDKTLSDAIAECLETIVLKSNLTREKILFKFIETERLLSVNRILYIESNLHKLEFHILEKRSRIFSLYDTLNNLEQRLDNQIFLRIHQSYLVNLNYIESMQRYEVILADSTRLPISKTRYNTVRDAFILHQGAF